MFIIKPKWVKEIPYAFTAQALILTFFQGPLSFKADYENMTNDSIYHIIDRIVAHICFAFYIYRLAVLSRHTTRTIAVMQSLTLALALTFFTKSRKAQMMDDPANFCFWHNMWHTAPLITEFVDFVEVFFIEKERTLMMWTNRSRGSSVLRELRHHTRNFY